MGHSKSHEDDGSMQRGRNNLGQASWGQELIIHSLGREPFSLTGMKSSLPEALQEFKSWRKRYMTKNLGLMSDISARK